MEWRMHWYTRLHSPDVRPPVCNCQFRRLIAIDQSYYFHGSGTPRVRSLLRSSERVSHCERFDPRREWNTSRCVQSERRWYDGCHSVSHDQRMRGEPESLVERKPYRLQPVQSDLSAGHYGWLRLHLCKRCSV